MCKRICRQPEVKIQRGTNRLFQMQNTKQTHPLGYSLIKNTEQTHPLGHSLMKNTEQTHPLGHSLIKNIEQTHPLRHSLMKNTEQTPRNILFALKKKDIYIRTMITEIYTNN